MLRLHLFQERTHCILQFLVQKVILNNQIVLSESKDQSSVEVTLANWILISDEDDIPVSVNQVVTLVEPVASIKKPC